MEWKSGSQAHRFVWGEAGRGTCRRYFKQLQLQTSLMSSLNAGTFKLFCFILQKSTNTFHIDIAASETVSDLKDAILAKNPNSLRNVESQQLNLYKVCDLTFINLDKAYYSLPQALHTAITQY